MKRLDISNTLIFEFTATWFVLFVRIRKINRPRAEYNTRGLCMVCVSAGEREVEFAPPPIVRFPIAYRIQQWLPCTQEENATSATTTMVSKREGDSKLGNARLVA